MKPTTNKRIRYSLLAATAFLACSIAISSARATIGSNIFASQSNATYTQASMDMIALSMAQIEPGE